MNEHAYDSWTEVMVYSLKSLKF